VIIAVVQEALSQEIIEKTAESQSVDCLCLSEEETLFTALQEGTPGVIFIEIGLAAIDGPSLVQKLKQNPSTRKIPLVAFGNSLRADLLQDAKELGADLALPKSAFRDQLPSLIRRYSKSNIG
jgi:CheY-like chemotaxis protein